MVNCILLANFFSRDAIKRLARTGPKRFHDLHLPGHNNIPQSKDGLPMLQIKTVFLLHS